MGGRSRSQTGKPATFPLYKRDVLTAMNNTALRIKNKACFLSRLVIFCGGDDETRTRDLPAGSAGRSNQKFDVFLAFASFDFVLSFDRTGAARVFFRIDLFPGSLGFCVF
jgi:hypothetical protein